jgi:predicted ATPase/class 3 adenylate cyclase
MNCGTPFVQAPERRKLATMLFCDMSGSTALGERVDAETIRALMARYFETMRGAIERHGGTVEKYIGDAVMAVFGIPTAHEDDALRALRAALEMRERLAALNEEFATRFGEVITLRIGVNTGEVVAGDATSRQTLVTGDAVNVAARLEQAAAPGEILLGPETYRLARNAITSEPVQPLALKGKSGPLLAYRLLSLRKDALTRTALETPLVGRKVELQLLEDAFADVVATRTPHLLTVVGEPGVGKSRLARELLARVGMRARVLEGRCLSYGEGITYWAIGEIVRQTAGIKEEDSPVQARAKITALAGGAERAELAARRVSQAIGLEGGQAPGEEIAWAIRYLLQALARERPVLLLVDDIHWGEPAFLDLVARLAEPVPGGSLLCICLARRELLEKRPEWETSIRLEPLGAEEEQSLLATLLGEARLSDDFRVRIATVAAGNPFFLEELFAMLVEEGILVREEGAWRATADLSRLAIPTTLASLLGARLDLLGAEPRAALERGSVEGEVFHRGALAALSERTDVNDALETLMGKEYVRPSVSDFIDEAAFRFRHILIRDAAYEAIPKRVRAELHERFADWLNEKVGERAGEVEEILGYHLEQAFRYMEQLGAADPQVRRLGKRAAERLGSAGRRALERDDVDGAAGLLTRATSLLAGSEPLRVELLLELGRARRARGELQKSGEVLAEAFEAASAGGDRRLEHHALVEFQITRELMEPGPDEVIAEVSERAIRVFEEHGDDLGLARALRLANDIYWGNLQFAEAARTLERALVHARRAGDGREEAAIIISLGGAYCGGPMPVPDALRRCSELLPSLAGWRAGQAAFGFRLAWLQAMLGHFAEARKLCAASVRVQKELDLTLARAHYCETSGIVELLAENPVAAEREFRLGVEMLEPLGETSRLPTLAAWLAEALYEQGRLEEAETFLTASAKTAADDDVITHILWRGVRGKLEARRGAFEEARLAASEAVQLAARTDTLSIQADSLMNLAEVLRLADEREGARRAGEEALELYRQKGNLVSANRARETLAELAIR